MPIDRDTNESVPFTVLEERGWTRETLRIHRFDGSAQG